MSCDAGEVFGISILATFGIIFLRRLFFIKIYVGIAIVYRF